MQLLPTAEAPHAPDFEAQEKHGYFPLMTGRAFLSLARPAPPAAPLFIVADLGTTLGAAARSRDGQPGGFSYIHVYKKNRVSERPGEPELQDLDPLGLRSADPAWA